MKKCSCGFSATKKEFKICPMCGNNLDNNNEKILEVLRYIKLFNKHGVLEEEFKAFSQYDEDIETIDDLLEACETEVSYWEA